MQDQNADTEWNDALRKHGIIPEKEKEITEDDLVAMLEETIQKKASGKKDMGDMNLDELDELEDEEDERVLAQFRQKRIAEMQALHSRSRYGSLEQISSADFIGAVNKAGDGVWVIVHLFKSGLTVCERMNQHLTTLARKFPTSKFLKIVSTNCIPNYPDKNLPTLLIYHNGEMKKQIVGVAELGGQNGTAADLEWVLKRIGAVESDMEENPREKERIKDIMSSSVRGTASKGRGDSDDDDYD